MRLILCLQLLKIWSYHTNLWYKKTVSIRVITPKVW